uniref:C2H2-type domain-containing protein n=1 Tax=Globisporangium ultimum (strain ATCC 200006 / CBS 805.95 / DAOM BR144) TaxID=431595 RepID=K3WG11_GLOUD
MRIVAPDAMCASISEPRAPLGCVFRHDATRFACTACAAEFRSVRELAAHRRRAHRSLVFQDWYESSCACRALFTARLDAFPLRPQCEPISERRPLVRRLDNESGRGCDGPPSRYLSSAVELPPPLS